MSSTTLHDGGGTPTSPPAGRSNFGPLDVAVVGSAVVPCVPPSLPDALVDPLADADVVGSDELPVSLVTGSVVAAVALPVAPPLSPQAPRSSAIEPHHTARGS
jgi:hypothetical protein